MKTAVDNQYTQHTGNFSLPAYQPTLSLSLSGGAPEFSEEFLVRMARSLMFPVGYDTLMSSPITISGSVGVPAYLLPIGNYWIFSVAAEDTSTLPGGGTKHVNSCLVPSFDSPLTHPKWADTPLQLPSLTFQCKIPKGSFPRPLFEGAAPSAKDFNEYCGGVGSVWVFTICRVPEDFPPEIVRQVLSTGYFKGAPVVPIRLTQPSPLITLGGLYMDGVNFPQVVIDKLW